MCVFYVIKSGFEEQSEERSTRVAIELSRVDRATGANVCNKAKTL